MPVGNVHGQDAVGPQMSKVKLKSFDGQQVNRNGVAGEGIDGQEIKLLRWLAFQREARVPA